MFQDLRRRAVTLTILVGLLASACSTPTTPQVTSVPPQPTSAPAQPTSPPPTQPPTVVPTEVMEEPTEMAEPTEAAAEPVTLRFAVFGEPAEIEAYEDVSEHFEEENPQYKIDLEITPSAGDFATKLAAAFTAGNPPDVMTVSYRRLGQLASKGAFEILEPYLEQSSDMTPDMFYPLALEAYTWDGQIVCAPINISSSVIYYNKDIFDQAGVDYPEAGWTWEDFVETAKAVTLGTDNDGETDVWGFDTTNDIRRLAPFIWQHGGDLVDDLEHPTKLLLDSPEAIEALQFFADLQLKEHVRPSQEEGASEEPDERFIHGELAMVMSSRVATPEFLEEGDMNWDVVVLPQDQEQAAVLHSEGICMAATTEKKDAAWDFIHYALGPTGQNISAEAGRTVPSLKSIAESDAFLNPDQPPANDQAWLDQLDYIRRLPNTSAWASVEGVLETQITAAVYGDASPADAAAEAVTEAGELFAQDQ